MEKNIFLSAISNVKEPSKCNIYTLKIIISQTESKLF